MISRMLGNTSKKISNGQNDNIIVHDAHQIRPCTIKKEKKKRILTLISIWLKINIRKSSNMIICMFSRKNGILTSTYNCVCGIDIPGHCNFTKYVFMRCTISRTKQTSRMLFLVHCKWLYMLHRENQRQSKIGKESLNVNICIYIFWQIANLPF